jgi:hypothetical protein
VLYKLSQGPSPRRRQAIRGSTWGGRSSSVWREGLLTPVLPRKEVIQPHLPVRLPCYDFTPVTDPTLDICPPCGLAQRLQVFPAPMV